MKRYLIFLLNALMACVLTLVSGCGGSGGGSGGSSGSPFEGIYQASFSRAVDNVLLVVVSRDGTTEAVVSDEDGVLVQGVGTTDATGSVTIQMAGRGGNTTLTGTFSRAPGLDANLTGGLEASVQAGKRSESSFSGKFKVTYNGSASGELNIVIATNGKVYKRVGTSQTLIGTISKTGAITFSGEGLINPPTAETEWTGTIFITPNSMGGSGTWKDSSNASFQGNWSAIPDVGNGTPIFNQISIIKGFNPSSVITVLGASPNKHMVGHVGSSAVYWSDPDATPVVLENAPGTSITFPTAVNESGTSVGYCYLPDGLIASRAVVWHAGSTTPTELRYPEEYVSGIANDINASGVIVGLVRKANGATRPCIWPSATADPIIPEQGDAVRVSNAGVVLCKANKGWLPNIQASSMNTLPPPPGYGLITVETMGANGIIVGTAELGGDGVRRPVAWHPLAYGPQALAFTPGFQEMKPTAAGNDGTFIGTGKMVGSNSTQAIYWKNANEVVILDDVVANPSVLFHGGQYMFADGSVIAYGRDLSNFPVTAWLRP